MSGKKAKGARPVPNLDLLDAYTGSGPAAAAPADKPVFKKNKNRRKREQQQQQQQKEERERRESEKAEAADGTEVILDSWGDMDDVGDAAPPPPEFVIDQSAVAELKRKEEAELKVKKAARERGKDPKVKAALGNLRLTIESVTEVLKAATLRDDVKGSTSDDVTQCQKKAGRVNIAVDDVTKGKSQKGDDVIQGKSQEDDVTQGNSQERQGAETKPREKTKEDIKAEREAKKKAKQMARAAKNEGKTVPDFVKKEEKPKETKAERRAKQEAQRAAKEAEKSAGKVTDKAKEAEKAAGRSAADKAKEVRSSEKKHRVPEDIQADLGSVEKKLRKRLASQNLPQRPKAQKKVMLFSHLHQYEKELSISRDLPAVGSHIHPAVVALGLRYANGTVQGSNARCLDLMRTLKVVVGDYSVPEDRQFSRDLDANLKTYITFLKGCRNHSVSMGNAIRYLKSKINGIKAAVPEEEARKFLLDSIDGFISGVELAAKQISITACEKIRDGDVILTYGCSSLLKSVFEEAAEQGRRFKVIVADGRPRFEGREMARSLLNSGIHCTYVLVHSLSFIINEVSKVFLGAHAVFANGYMMSRVGTAQVAMMAKAQNIPVLVCCETYKFSDRVQTDSFVFNELGDPDDLVATGNEVSSLEDWRDLGSLNLLNLSYDVTPASYIDAIISEISVIPCTSVPVVLRLKSLDLN